MKLESTNSTNRAIGLTNSPNRKPSLSLNTTSTNTSGVSNSDTANHGSKMKPEIIDQNERINRYGIECKGPVNDGICFAAGTWTPGGEYIQKLIIRNVGTSVKKIKYQLPTTRYFSLLYPETIILSPGMFREIDVIFRPVETEEYDDTIYFKVLEGLGSSGFHVPVRAFIDHVIVEAPFGADFGYVATHQSSSISFKLENKGEVDAPFRWESPLPFVLEPSSGVIPAGYYINITATIYPLDASVFVSQAVCYIGEGLGSNLIIPQPIVSTKISAIGKYNFISLSESEINYGPVLSGTPINQLRREVVLKNNSVVPAEFELVKHDFDSDVFEITPSSGVIQPCGSVDITVVYYPLAIGTFSIDRFTFRTPSNSTTVLTCRASSIAPSITINKNDVGTKDVPVDTNSASPDNSINFRDLEIGAKATMITYLKNSSNKSVLFCIDMDENSTFKVEPKQGMLLPLQTSFAIRVTFSPKQPINYYRRVFVILGDALPMYFDVMGSGYIRANGNIKEQRPFPLRHAHVQAYRNRSMMGAGGLSPDELDKLYERLQEEQQATHYNDAIVPKEYFAIAGVTGTRALSVTTVHNAITRSGGTTRQAIAPANEYFIALNDTSAKEVVIDKCTFDFGFTPYSTTSEHKLVTITNNTNGKVALLWQLPSSSEPSAFEIEPMTADINSLHSCQFKIRFKPMQSDKNFVSEMECFVYFKNQRTFRLVNDSTMTPPWCLPIVVVGHTFASGQLLARVKMCGGSIRNGKVTFPPTYERDSNYQTITLKNTSNLPSKFEFFLGWEDTHTHTGGKKGTNRGASSPLDDVFMVKPMVGEVAADGFAVVCVRFNPLASSKYSQLLRLVVNGEKSGQVLLEGTGGTPFIFCPNVGDYSNYPIERLGINSDVMTCMNCIPNGHLGSFYLNPTCVGLSSNRVLQVKNGSRIPLKYVITLPVESNGIIALSQYKGILFGNETADITISFAPYDATEYNFKLKIRVYAIGGRPDRVIDARQTGYVDAPEALQSISCMLVCPGEIGALLFHPCSICNEVQLVSTQQMSEVYLENPTDSDIEYKLYYNKRFFSDTDADSSSSNSSDMYPLLSSNDVIYCTKPSGTICARSSVRATVTFQPNDAGLFEFTISAHIKALDYNKRPVMISNDESALLRVSQADRLQMSLSLNSMSDNMMDATSTLVNLPLIATLVGRAAYPTLFVEDIRTDINNSTLIRNVEQLWRQFSVTAINRDLCIPLTAAEQALNNKSSPALSEFKRYAFQFTPAVIGSKHEVMYLSIKNSGYLAASLNVYFANEKSLNLEGWCNENDPSEELNRTISIIEELKVFTFEPRQAVLLPGESQVFKCSYSYTYLKYNGYHKIPILVKITNGKQFYIDMIGHTLSIATSKTRTSDVVTCGTPNIRSTRLTEEMLIIPCDCDSVMRLNAVPIGLSPSLAPMQATEIVNVSSADIAYEVDTAVFDDIMRMNNKMPVIALGKSKGTIKAYSSEYLHWYFCPFEAKRYSFPLKLSYASTNVKGVRIDAGSSSSSSSTGSSLSLSPSKRASSVTSKCIEFTIEAVGYDGRRDVNAVTGTTYKGREPDGVRLLTLSDQLLCPSVDLIDFGVTLQATRGSRILILQNLQSCAIDFVIDGTLHLFKDKVLTCRPMQGIIPAGSKAVVEVILNGATSCMSISDCFLITVCKVIEEDHKRRRQMLNTAADVVTNKPLSSTYDHRSVLSRCTTAQASRLTATPVPTGKVASTPSTFTADGTAVGAALNLIDTFIHSGSILSVSDGSITEVTASSDTPIASAQSSKLPSRNDRSRPSFNGTYLKADPNKPVVAGQVQRILQLGLPQYMYIRVKGDVLPVEVVVNFVGKADICRESMLPKVLPYIAPKSSMNSSSSSSNNQRDDNVDDDGNSVGSVSIKQAVLPARELEVRSFNEFIMHEVFNDILSTSSVVSLVRETIETSTPTTLALMSPDEGVVGKAVMGLYYDEIKQQHALLATEAVAVVDELVSNDIDNTSDLGSYSIAGDGRCTSTSVEEVIVSDDFIGIASDILKSTMLNLVSEAVYGEFVVDAEAVTLFSL